MGIFKKAIRWGSVLILLAIGIIALLEPDFGLIFGDKSYRELELRVEARILPDGSMSVRETRILDFKGEFSRYRRQIPHRGFSNMVDVKVSEPGIPYTLIHTPTGRPEGRFALSKSQSSGATQEIIELFFAAKDQQRTFIIEYRLTDVVTIYNDVAEVYWKFIGANRSTPIEKMSVTLSLPPGAPLDAVKIWGHGPTRGTVKKISASEFSWQTTKLPKEKFLEGRIIFPPNLVPQAKKRVNKTALPGILQEEQRWADQRAAEERRALYEIIAAAIMSVGGVLLAIGLYFRYGRKHKSSMEIEYYRELPGNYSPAEAGCLFENGKVKPQGVAATFMDLARRGYLRMEPAHNSQSEDILVHQLKPAGEDLAAHERLLLEFFFGRVGNMQTAVWFSALKEYRKKDMESTRIFSTAFQSVVAEKTKAMNFWEKNNRCKTIGFICTFASMIGIMAGLYGDWHYFAISCIIATLAFMTALIICRDLTPEGQQQYDLWQAFRRFLKDFSNLDRAQMPQLILWEHYLVYAVALGVAKEVIKQLPIVYPQVNDPNYQFAPYWGSMYHSRYRSDGILQDTSYAGFNTLSSLVDSMDATWNNAYSAATSSGSSSGSGGGDGGGFSGGGGDGGGGGGGDAD